MCYQSKKNNLDKGCVINHKISCMPDTKYSSLSFRTVGGLFRCVFTLFLWHSQAIRPFTNYYRISIQLYIFFDCLLESLPGNTSEDHLESWNHSSNWSQSKHQGQHAPPFPTQLPTGADLPSCTGSILLVGYLHFRYVCLVRPLLFSIFVSNSTVLL